MNNTSQQTTAGRNWSSQAPARVTATLFRLSRVTNDCIVLDYDLNLIAISPPRTIVLVGRALNKRKPCSMRYADQRMCGMEAVRMGERVWSTRHYRNRT